jgi:hypothetical protein
VWDYIKWGEAGSLRPLILIFNLGFADFEHLGAAGWTRTLGGWPLVLHDDGLGVLHFLLSAAFNTITLNHNCLLY